MEYILIQETILKFAQELLLNKKELKSKFQFINIEIKKGKLVLIYVINQFDSKGKSYSSSKKKQRSLSKNLTSFSATFHKNIKEIIKNKFQNSTELFLKNEKEQLEANLDKKLSELEQEYSKDQTLSNELINDHDIPPVQIIIIAIALGTLGLAIMNSFQSFQVQIGAFIVFTISILGGSILYWIILHKLLPNTIKEWKSHGFFGIVGILWIFGRWLISIYWTTIRIKKDNYVKDVKECAYLSILASFYIYYGLGLIMFIEKMMK